MPIEMFIRDEHQLRTHLRAVHNITLLSHNELQQYLVTDRPTTNRRDDRLKDNHRVSSGVNLTATEFSDLIEQVQQSIQTGVERGMSMAFGTTSAINYYADIRSGGNNIPPRLLSSFEKSNGSQRQDVL